MKTYTYSRIDQDLEFMNNHPLLSDNRQPKFNCFQFLGNFPGFPEVSQLFCFVIDDKNDTLESFLVFIPPMTQCVERTQHPQKHRDFMGKCLRILF